MIKLRTLLFMAVLLAAVGYICLKSPSLYADAGHVIDDSVFNNTSSMSTSQIDSFLNGFSTSCISTNNGFSTPDPLGFSGGAYQFGGNVSGGRAIRDIATKYNMNPQVLIAQMQKEQSIPTGGKGCHYDKPNPSDPSQIYTCTIGSRTGNCTDACPFSYGGGCMNIAMSYGCPGSCWAASEGFGMQISAATWLMRFSQVRANGTLTGYAGYDSGDEYYTYSGPLTPGNRQRVIGGPTISSDGTWTDNNGNSVVISNGATASLYAYTPFITDTHFQEYFTQWFGSTTAANAPYAWNLSSATSYVDAARTAPFTNSPSIYVAPGGTAYVTLRAQNKGYQTWAQSTVHLGTTYPGDRSSVFFNNSWLSPQRAQMQESSVPPGETATFIFSLTAPNTPGTYVEHFSLVADGIAWMNDPGFYFAVNVTTPTVPTNSKNTGLSIGQYITPNMRLMSPDSQSVLTLLPNGNVVLYADFKPIWNNNVNNSDAQVLVLQSDGNLVEYDSAGHALWSSRTNGTSNHLALQTDGNVVMYTGGGSPVWATNTGSTPNHLSKVNTNVPAGGVMYPGQYIQTADRAYTLVLQEGDGNLVEYDSAGRAVWSSGTSGNSNVLVSQEDGNIVIYGDRGKALWSSGTGGGGNALTIQPSGMLAITNGNNSVLWRGAYLKAGQYIQTADRAYTLVLQEGDGNLVEYDSAGRAVWSSGTKGGKVLVLQDDGNLVIYGSNGRALWASNTRGSSNVLALQSDGNLVMYGSGRALWASRR